MANNANYSNKKGNPKSKKVSKKKVSKSGGSDSSGPAINKLVSEGGPN